MFILIIKLFRFIFYMVPPPSPPPQLAEQRTFFIISVNICVNYLFATMLKTIKVWKKAQEC